MSYNILKKNVKFSGPADGTIEGMVDVSSSQEIVGDKTFTSTITSSADVMLSGSGKVSASFFYGDGSSLSGVSGVPAGTDGNIQFTDGSALGASSNLTFFTSSNKLEVLGEISASVNVSASAFYGDGANLTSVTASFVTASNIFGLVEANQIKRAPGLSDDGGFLTIDTASNGGITISSGLAIDANDLPSANWSTDGDTIIGYIGGNTRKIEFSELTDHLPINANNIDSGTLLNARLPTTISVSVVSASTAISGAFFEGDGSGLTGVTGTPTPGGANTEIQFNDDGALTGAPDLTFSTSSFTLATVNISASGYVSASSYAIEGGTIIDANADITCGNITMQDGVGTLNFGDNQVSGSGNISGSQFYGDGSTLSNLPVQSYSDYTENRILAAGATTGAIKGLAAVTFNNPTLNVVGNVSASINISASAFYGDGSNLQNVSAVPSIRFHYLNTLGGINHTQKLFFNLMNPGTNTSMASLRACSFIAPSSGSLERIVLTPTDVGSLPTSGESIKFGMTKNSVTTYANSNVAVHATSSYDIAYTFDTTNTDRAVFDFRNNSPAYTGSLVFDPGEILGFNFQNGTGVTNNMAITIVLSFSEEA